MASLVEIIILKGEELEKRLFQTEDELHQGPRKTVTHAKIL